MFRLISLASDVFTEGTALIRRNIQFNSIRNAGRLRTEIIELLIKEILHRYVSDLELQNHERRLF